MMQLVHTLQSRQATRHVKPYSCILWDHICCYLLLSGTDYTFQLSYEVQVGCAATVQDTLPQAVQCWPCLLYINCIYRTLAQRRMQETLGISQQGHPVRICKSPALTGPPPSQHDACTALVLHLHITCSNHNAHHTCSFLCSILTGPFKMLCCQTVNHSIEVHVASA